MLIFKRGLQNNYYKTLRWQTYQLRGQFAAGLKESDKANPFQSCMSFCREIMYFISTKSNIKKVYFGGTACWKGQVLELN